MTNRVLPQVKAIIPVASGKGGVGKSTLSANLALALSRQGAKIGLMDADVYGPSIPKLMAITERPLATSESRIVPVTRYGVKMISTGFFIPANEAVIWRGPMLHKMMQDFLGAVDWGELDVLLIDLPPGTGDVQLSICQSVPVTGAVIVSTPQDVAWNVAQKAIMMFDKLNAPVLGVVENMSVFVCGHCGHKEEIFGHGGARRAAERLGIPFLGEIPLATAVRTSSDAGEPIVQSHPESEAAKAIFQVAQNLMKQAASPSLQAQRPVPVKISPPGQATVEIKWSDGKKSILPAKVLRLACPCAVCVNEVTGQRRLNPAAVPDGIRATAIQTVGRYALQITWSDGHSTGLYGFAYLRDPSIFKLLDPAHQTE